MILPSEVEIFRREREEIEARHALAAADGPLLRLLRWLIRRAFA